MPKITLVVCIHEEAALLKRLLIQSQGLFDDLVVVHDGPAKTDEIKELVIEYGGRFFVRPRAFQQEPHWPFAWEQARYDWILRWDADEFPSLGMKEWLKAFREGADPETAISGYTCIWPLWNGVRPVTRRYPDGRIFMINRQRVRFFGMAENVPEPDGQWAPLPLTLQHEPPRASYGLRNILSRRQAYLWRHVIARSLLLPNPGSLPCWRWNNPEWPVGWRQIREQPVWTGIKRLIKYPVSIAMAMLKRGEFPRPGFCWMLAAHHFLICMEFIRLRQHPEAPFLRFHD